MLGQPKLLSWSSAKSRILNQLEWMTRIHDGSSFGGRRTSSITSKIPQTPLFSSRSFTKFDFDTNLQAFTYYRSFDTDEHSTEIEDMIITSLYYDDPKDPRSAIVVYFTSLTTGLVRRQLKYDFQFPSFQLLKYISKLKLIIGYSNNRLYILSNKSGDLKFLNSVACPGVARRIIYDKAIRDFIYVGGDNGFFVRWYLVRNANGYDFRIGERLRSVFINRQHNIIDMKLDPIKHTLFIVGHKGCLIFDTLLNRETTSVLSAHGAPVTSANIYGVSIIMGFSDGLMKIFEIGNESVPLRYQFQAHRDSIKSILITGDGVIISGAVDGTVCFYSLETFTKLGEHRFKESVERMMFVRGEDLLIKFKSDLQLLIYTLPVRSFSGAIQSIEQVRVTFPVGSIPSRIVVRSSQNLFTMYNPRSSNIINFIPLSPDRIVVNDFVFDTAGEVLYVLTSKTVCSYACGSYPSYLLSIFDVEEECIFTKLCCFMWFSLLPEHTRKRRAFGVVFVGTTNGKVYLVPGDHALKYALLPDTPEALYSNFQVLSKTTTVSCLEIFQSYETYTTRRGARYLLAIGSDFVAKFYRLSINDHEIFLRQLGSSIYLDAPAIGAAMAESRIAIACNLRGYLNMYAITNYGLDEISPKDILYEHSPIKSLTGCDSLGLFTTVNVKNEIMLWTRKNEIVKKLICDFPIMSIANLNDRGDILLVSNRRLNFIMISDFAPEQVLFDLSKKTIRDDSLESPVQINKSFDQNLLQSAKTIQLDEKPTPKLAIDYDTSDTLGFFEAIEKEKAQAEMAKMLEKKKQCPIAPDALIPNSTLRSMFKIKEIEPVKVKMFQLRLDILQNLENKTNKNINWQNDDDEWVELADPDADFGESSSKPPSAKKTKSVRPVTGTLVSSKQNTIPELFKQMKKERWWKLTDEDGNNNLRSMLMYLIDILKAKQSDSYPSACTYVVEIFRTYGIEPALVDQILSILLGHLSEGGENDPLNAHTVRAIAQFMIEKKDIIVRLLEFALQCKSNDTLQFETINAVKFITDVNSFEDIDLALNNMAVVRDAAEDTFSLKMIIERIKSKPRKTPSDLTNEATPAAEESEKVEETIHPLLKKISAEKWYPRDENPITLDSVLDAIIAKLPTASKNMLKALTGHIIQLHRLLGFSNEQFDRVANGIISLLSHTDADHRLIAATVLAELGRETKAVDIALLNSFTNDPRILVRTECCDALKRITGIMSDTVLKDCADDIPFLETLPEEGFSLKNYWNDKHRVLTPPVPSIVVEDEPVVPTDEKDQEIPYIDEDQAEKSDIDVEDTGHQPTLDHERTEDATILIRSRSQSPQIHDDPSHETQKHRLHPQNSQFSITPSLNSSTAPITPIQPAIRVEIRETTKLTTKSSPNEPKSRREKQPSDSHTPQGRRQPTIVTDRYGQTPNKTTLSDKSLRNRQPLLPPNPQMWQSYEKQRENTLLNNINQPSSTDMHQDQMADSVQAIIDHHTNTMGYYRMRPNRRVLIPHKISFDMIFGDLSHITVNKKPSSQSPSFITSSMHLSDLNRNKRHLHEVEFVQLLSSLVIRAIQLHRKNEAFAPGSLASMTSSSMNFTDALTVSQMQLHSMNDFQQPSLNSIQRLPPISRARPSSAEAARMKAEAQSRATRAGVNLHKTRQMEDALSNLLKSNREQTRSTLISGSTPYSPLVATSYDSNEITHAWLLEQLLRSQGTPNAQNYIHQISRTYPKFTPLLYSRIPSHLIPVIWNDPVMRQLASIIGNQQDDLSVEGLSTRQHTKPSLLTFDDEHSSNFFDYSASSQILAMQQQQREENKNEPLPTVRGVKMRLPRHVLKFGFREIESDSSPEESLVSLRDESIPKARRRRIYMHLMMSVNENMFARHELAKSQLRNMLKSDYQSTSFTPFTKRSPLFN